MASLNEFKGQPVALAGVAGDACAIRKTHFADCDIKGPAVMIPMRSEFGGCTFAGSLDSVVWCVSQKAVSGAILVEDCTFLDCRFENVGWVTNTAEKAAEVRAQLTPTS
jgi:hypothetical protein